MPAIPQKSSKQYLCAFSRFKAWQAAKGLNDYSENTFIAYFKEQATFNVQSTTMWTQLSFLKRLLLVKEGIDIAPYQRLRSFLKKLHKTYEPKKLPVFSRDQFFTFLTDAPDDTYLGIKVVMMIGVLGSCRGEEMINIRTDQIQDLSSLLYIQVGNCKEKHRTFTICGEQYIDIYRKYVALRPTNMPSSRFFIKYHDGRCYRAPMGIHKIGGAPREVARFLSLANWKEYSWNCLRKMKISET